MLHALCAWVCGNLLGWRGLHAILALSVAWLWEMSTNLPAACHEYGCGLMPSSCRTLGFGDARPTDSQEHKHVHNPTTFVLPCLLSVQCSCSEVCQLCMGQEQQAAPAGIACFVLSTGFSFGFTWYRHVQIGNLLTGRGSSIADAS